MPALSAALGGFANSLHAPVAWAGWLMGLALPVIVLVLVTFAGEKHRAQVSGRWRGSRGSGVALLFL